MKKINFQILSEYKDDNIIIISLSQLNKSDCIVSNSFVENFDFNPIDKYILGVNKIESRIFDSLIKINEKQKKEIVVYTKSSDILLASKILRLGFNNFFVLPFELQKFKNFLSDSIEEILVHQSVLLKDEKKINFDAFEHFFGESQKIIHIIELAKKVTLNNQVNALVLGETGTGKGLLAKCIHEASLRRNNPFVDINCAAIPHHLLESELFGYERGAFTDARSTKIGLMELAEDGTIFLDEVGDMSLEVQAKLLRAIDNKVIRRLGGTEDIPIKARIISATNQSLDILIEKGKFRRDLFHRLNVITLNIPPLRERKEDIMNLAIKFSSESSNIFNKDEMEFSEKVIEFLLNYSWPGNVRELRNSIERGILLSDSKGYKLEQMFLDFKELEVDSEEIHLADKFIVENSEYSLDEMTRIYVQKVLDSVDGNKSKAAKLLQISRPRLDRILK